MIMMFDSQIYTSERSSTPAPQLGFQVKILLYGTEQKTLGKLEANMVSGTYGATSCSGVCCKMRASESENQAKLDKWFMHFYR